MLLKKKAQFFLIAALIIVTLVFSFGAIYNSAQSSGPGPQQINSLAKEIKYESVQLANQGVYNGLPYDKISSNIVNLAYSYSKMYPEYNITLAYGSVRSSFGAVEFSDGVSSNPLLTTGVVGSNLTLTLNNVKYSSLILEGYNVYVIVWEEDKNERYITEA